MPADKRVIMVVTPHPDDAEFGIAGSVARWIREGHEVVYIVCTSGDKGSRDPAVVPEELALIREKEQETAAAVLGVKEVVFLRFPDQCLEDKPDFKKSLVRCMRKFRPYTVATTDPYRRYIWHRDHRITGQAVLDAVFPLARDPHSYPELLKDEGLAPHNVRELLFWGTREPNCWLDITETLPQKLEALACHVSQVGGEMFPRVEAWVKERGIAAARDRSYKYGEVFHREEINW